MEDRFDALYAMFALFVGGGLITHMICERRHRARWQPVRPRAPGAIRRTALWSIYMGQMALPGGLMGLYGLLAGGIGLISIPGMILAIRIWRLGYAMLRRDPGAEREARALHRFAVVLNTVLIAIALIIQVYVGWDFLPVTLFFAGYGAISFAHAEAMRRCADLLAEDRRARKETTDLRGPKAHEQRLVFESPSDRPGTFSGPFGLTAFARGREQVEGHRPHA
jgi:hypothetical protein